MSCLFVSMLRNHLQLFFHIGVIFWVGVMVDEGWVVQEVPCGTIGEKHDVFAACHIHMKLLHQWMMLELFRKNVMIVDKPVFVILFLEQPTVFCIIMKYVM